MIDWLQTDAAMQLFKNIGLVLFFGIFTAVVIWLLVQRRSRIRRWSQLPLEDDTQAIPATDDHSNL